MSIEVKILFDTLTSGHRMEYIHHLYMMMLQKPSERYIIVAPEDFQEKRAQYEWPESEHVRFDFIPLSETKGVNSSNLLIKSYRKSKLLKKYVTKHHATSVFVISLIDYIPVSPFIIDKKVEITGIIYKIYLYEWKFYSFFRKAVEVIKYLLLSGNNCIKNVLVLNDRSAAAKLNRLYHTDKFLYLVDPYNSTDYSPRDVRNDLNIPKENRIFLHFGSMNRRKGTLKILQAISFIPKEKRKQMSFIIAGVVQEDIKADFYQLLESVRKDCQIVVFDEYCSKEFIEDLCKTCDFIVIPYGVTAQSSGIIAYAANAQKPVIGPGDGLIGKLIRKNKLGIKLENVTPRTLAHSMSEIQPFNINTKYCEDSSIEVFQNQISQLF